MSAQNRKSAHKKSRRTRSILTSLRYPCGKGKTRDKKSGRCRQKKKSGPKKSKSMKFSRPFDQPVDSLYKVCLGFSLEEKNGTAIVANQLDETSQTLIEQLIRGPFVQFLKEISSFELKNIRLVFHANETISCTATINMDPRTLQYGDDFYSYIELINEKNINQLINQLTKDAVWNSILLTTNTTSYPYWIRTSNGQELNLGGVGVVPC